MPLAHLNLEKDLVQVVSRTTVGTNAVENFKRRIRKGPRQSKTINYIFNDKILQFLSVYRPPSTSPVEFVTSLAEYLDNPEHNKNITQFLIGDININIFDNSDTTNTYLDNMSNHGYISYINNYTRVQGLTKSCIDHIFVKDLNSYFQYAAFILQTSITDHFATILQLKSETKKPYKHPFKTAQSLSWATIYNANTLDAATDNFITCLTNITKTCTNKIKIKKSERKRHPWIIHQIIKDMRTKEELYRKMCTDPSEFNINRYKQARNKINENIKLAKKNYYQNRISNNGCSSSKLWKTINEFTSGTTKNAIDEIRVHDKKIINPQDITEHLVDYFTNIRGDLVKQRQQVTTNKPFPQKTVINSFYLEETNIEEVKRVILSLKNKTPGHDNLRAETLKYLFLEKYCWPGCHPPFQHQGDLSQAAVRADLGEKKAELLDSDIPQQGSFSWPGLSLSGCELFCSCCVSGSSGWTKKGSLSSSTLANMDSVSGSFGVERSNVGVVSPGESF
nr:unnamed protein product [Callosobruchus analis]